MKRGKEVYDWFPLWSDKWIWGSTRHELTHEERAIWVDLMALANKDDGFIRANDTTPYPTAQLAGMFTCSVDLLESTISKCLKYQKIEDRGNGIYYICNWEEYALSKRRKQQIARNCETASRNDTSLYSILLSSDDLSSPNLSWVGITDSDFTAWTAAYPACDIKRELLAMIEWIKSNPKKGKKENYRRFITNWLSKSQERGGGMKSNPRPIAQRRDIYEGFRAVAARQQLSGGKTNDPRA